MKQLLLLGLFFFSNIVIASMPSQAELDIVAASKKWHLLLHYQDKIFSGYIGNADHKIFYLADDGKENPLAELKANIELFLSDKLPPGYKWHAQCAYPARYRFVKESFPAINFKDQVCKDFLWWKNSIKAKSISVVFSSYYPSNVASIFGHTFVKLNTKEGSQERISDYALEFSAATGDGDAGILYMIKGMFGGFRGLFSTPPYYDKINAYVNIDSRDLWEYHLDFSPQEVELFLEHVWEVRMHTHFDYYFLDENCSYMLLTILNTVRPNINISQPYFFYALPIDTVRRLEDEGMIREVRYRPSAKKKMLAKQKSLTEEQLKLYVEIIEGKVEAKNITDREVLEAVISFYRYKRFELMKEPEVKDYKKKLLKAVLIRAKLGKKTDNKDKNVIEYYKKFDPLKGHAPYSFGIGGGYDNYRNEYINLRFRSGLHGIYNRGLGFPDFSRIEFFGVEGRYFTGQKEFKIQNLTFLKIENLLDNNLFDRNLSWGVNIDWELPQDFDSGNSLLTRLHPSIGLAKYFFDKKMALYSMLQANIEIGPVLNQGWRVGPQLELGMRTHPTLSFVFNAMVRGFFDLYDNFDRSTWYQYELGGTYSLARDWEIHARYLDTHTSSRLFKTKREGIFELRYMY